VNFGKKFKPVLQKKSNFHACPLNEKPPYSFDTWIPLQNNISKDIREGCKDLIMTDSILRQIMDKLTDQINKGLDHKTRNSSSVKCYVTYVQDLPSGKEKGKFLALDLGGTNFRVLLITLNERHFDMQSKIYTIPESIMTGTGEKLFDHIAECLALFTTEHRVNHDKLPLGFTFSFPLQQAGLTKGVLVRWTKGFNCSGVEGEDVVTKLKEAIARRGDVNINIYAILNDTTGTLMSCAWKNHNCRIGVILGTGTNACYVEKVENIPDFDGDKTKPNVIINTEWGAFGDNGELDLIRTEYDIAVDKSSINPGLQLHEKMISGMYLGEIVRQLLVKFTKSKILFEGRASEQLFTKGSFETKFVSEIEGDKKGTYKACEKIFNTLGITKYNEQDCANVRYVCECVSRRAAHLASAAIAALLNKMDVNSVTVGVDGSLYRFHPYFHNLMVDKISQLVNPSIMNVELMLSEDGSGRGAALVAASIRRS